MEVCCAGWVKVEVVREEVEDVEGVERVEEVVGVEEVERDEEVRVLEGKSVLLLEGVTTTTTELVLGLKSLEELSTSCVCVAPPPPPPVVVVISSPAVLVGPSSPTELEVA